MVTKTALHCSDVSGAFDRVKATKLVEKLQKKGVTGEILNVTQNSLGERAAKVIVNGTFSKTPKLNSMGFPAFSFLSSFSPLSSRALC